MKARIYLNRGTHHMRTRSFSFLSARLLVLLTDMQILYEDLRQIQAMIIVSVGMKLHRQLSLSLWVKN
jgi:hypothetical protein